MIVARRRTRWGGILILALVGVAACTSNGTEPEIDEAFIGNWNVTSFVMDGVEQVTPGGNFNVSFGFFSDGSYQMIVGGDTSGLLCGPGISSCVDSGDFSYSGNLITLDPGTVDALQLQVSVSSGLLNVSGNLDGTSFTATFERN